MPPQPRTRRRRTARALLVALGWALAAAGAVWVVLGAFPELQLAHPAAALAASFIPYGVAAWLVVTVVVVTSRRRWVRVLALLTVAALVLQVSWTRSSWPRHPAAQETDLTVLALNTYYGWADPGRLVAEVERVRPDVVVLSEVTTRTLEGLEEHSWSELLPHHVGTPGDDWESDAMMVFAPHPLRQLAGDTAGSWATLEVTAPVGPLTVIAVHAINPSADFTRWQEDLAHIGEEATTHTDGPLVVLGDFNAVREHQPFLGLLEGGLTDAAAQAGAGWTPTWPSRRLDRAVTALPYPPLIGIDHVLLGPGVRAAGFRTFTVDNTDHRGVVARLDVAAWP